MAYTLPGVGNCSFYVGNAKPAEFYNGNKKIVGWQEQEISSFPATIEKTYNDTADVIVKGNTVQLSEWRHAQGQSTQEVITRGKNIFDGKIESGYFSNTGEPVVSTTLVRTVNHIAIDQTKNYVLSRFGSTEGTSMYVYYYDSEKVFISLQSTYSASQALTIPSTAKFLTFRTSMSYTNFQLEEGTVGTAYEEYREIKPTPSNPSPIVSNIPAGTYKVKDWKGDWYEFTLSGDLAGNAGYKDSVEYNKYSNIGYLRKNWHTGALNLSDKTFAKTGEAWQRTGCFSAYVQAALPYNGALLVDGREDFCNMLKYGSWAWSSKTEPYNYFIAGNNNSHFYFILPLSVIGCAEEDTDATKLAAAKAFFTSNPPTVAYLLATPARTPLVLTKNNASTAPELPMAFLTDTPSIEYPAQVWDAGGTVMTRGLNLWDEQWEVGSYNSSTGAKEANATRIRSKNMIPCLSETEYYFECGTYNQLYGIHAYFYEQDKTYLGHRATYNVARKITSPAGAKFMAFNLHEEYGATYNNDICINVSDPLLNGTYERYKAPTTAEIPVLRSVNAVSDEYNLETGNKLQKVSDWFEIGGYMSFYASEVSTNAKRVQKTISGESVSTNSNIVGVRHDGMLLTPSETTSGIKDAIEIDSGNLLINVGNDDSGWGFPSVPSTYEMKAYFYGWQMCHEDGRSPYYKNEVAYDSTWTGWNTGSAEKDGTYLIVENAASSMMLSRQISLKPSTKYGILVHVTDNTSVKLSYPFLGMGSFPESDSINLQPGDTGLFKLVATTNSAITDNAIYAYFPADNGRVSFGNYRVFELSTESQIEQDFASLTADQLNTKYPFDSLNVKHWKQLVGTDAEKQASITSTIPTDDYDGYITYKVIYELGTPVESQHEQTTLPTYYRTTVFEVDNETPASMQVEAKILVEDLVEQ